MTEPLRKKELLGKSGLYFLSLCILLASFPVSIAVNSLTMGLIFFFFLLDTAHLREHVRLYWAEKRNLILLALFCILLISLLYTQNISKGITKIIAYLPVIILPLSLTKLQTLPGRQLTFLKRWHIIVCALASLYCLLRVALDSGAFDGSYVGKVAPELYTAYFVHRFTYHELSQKVSLHAVYFSFFIAFAMALTLMEVKVAQRKKRLGWVLVLVFFALMLFLLKSVTINFAFYSFLLLYCYFSFSFKRLRHHVIFYLLVAFASIVVLYQWVLKYVGSFSQNAYLFQDATLNRMFFFVPALLLGIAILAVVLKIYFVRRYLMILSFSAVLVVLCVLLLIFRGHEKRIYVEDIKGSGVNNIIARSGNWSGALMIIKENPITGVGLGDEISALTEKYKELNFDVGVQQKFGAHNQYLEFWISGGIVAFLCFVFLLLLEMYKALLTKNISLLSLVYFFSIFCLTESAMSRQDGKIFFLFFICVLGSKACNAASPIHEPK